MSAKIVSVRLVRKRGRPLGSRNRRGMARPVDHRARTFAAWQALAFAFGARLRVLREEQDISAVKLADAIGCSHPTIWGWERGSKLPSLATMLLVAAALDCSLVDLMPNEAHYRVQPILERRPA